MNDIAELYAELFPYICKDFIYKEDLYKVLGLSTDQIVRLENALEARVKVLLIEDSIDLEDIIKRVDDI